MLVEWKGGDRRRSPRCRAWGWLLGWIGGALKVSVVDISMGGAYRTLSQHAAWDVLRPNALAPGDEGQCKVSGCSVGSVPV